MSVNTNNSNIILLKEYNNQNLISNNQPNLKQDNIPLINEPFMNTEINKDINNNNQISNQQGPNNPRNERSDIMITGRGCIYFCGCCGIALLTVFISLGLVCWAISTVEWND